MHGETVKFWDIVHLGLLTSRFRIRKSLSVLLDCYICSFASGGIILAGAETFNITAFAAINKWAAPSSVWPEGESAAVVEYLCCIDGSETDNLLV
jgi:hypothetical protein